MTDALIYKGYKLELLAGTSSHCGMAQGLSDLLFFCEQKDSEIERAFISCIDEYYKVCRIVEKEAETPYYGMVEISLSRRNKEFLTKEALRRRLSLEDLITDVLRQYIDFLR